MDEGSMDEHEEVIDGEPQSTDNYDDDDDEVYSIFYIAITYQRLISYFISI